MKKTHPKLRSPLPMYSVIIAFSGLSNFVGAQASYNLDPVNIPPVPPLSGDNCGFGRFALNTSVSSGQNTAMGNYALMNLTSGEMNTANGFEALFNNTTGNRNVGIGFRSLFSNCINNTVGTDNTALGQASLFFNESGDENCAVGSEALYVNTMSGKNTAIGTKALYNNDATGMGIGDNTAVGSHAMFAHENGPDNVAVGAEAQANLRFGFMNTSVGCRAMKGNSFTSIASNNTAVGHSAMHNIDDGVSNTATGMNALYMGGGNQACTAFGMGAMYTSQYAPSPLCGVGNVAVGYEAQYNSLYQVANTAVGYHALYHATSGNFVSGSNVAVGAAALTNNNSGLANSSAGFWSLNKAGPFYFNTAIGALTDITSSSIYNSGAIGYQAVPDSSNKIRIGNAAVSYYETPVAVTPSDGRFKSSIREDEVKGLEFINLLRPVTYNFDTKSFNEHMTQSISDSLRGTLPELNYAISSSIKHSGFIAQEVEEAAKKCGYKFHGIEIPKSDKQHYALSYDLFVVPLVKALQEQQLMVEAQALAKDSLLNRLMLNRELLRSYNFSRVESIASGNEINTEHPVQVTRNENAKLVVVQFESNSSNDVNVVVSDLLGVPELQVKSEGKTQITFPVSTLNKGLHILTVLNGTQLLAKENLIIN